MNKLKQQEIYVYADWKDLPNRPILFGILFVNYQKKPESYSFEYSSDWLNKALPYDLDPQLPSYSGRIYPECENFGFIFDSLPDRWGQILISRLKKSISLSRADMLLTINDLGRMGGIRFKINPEGDFLNHQDSFIPPLENLRKLQQLAKDFETKLNTNEDIDETLRLLVAPGSSLGGARPKANVIDTDGNLWIAKFPSKNDRYDIGAWEYVVNCIAKSAGINVTESNILKLDDSYHTYLSKRFDRSKADRIHYASAYTLLGVQDGKEGLSYLDLAELITRESCDVIADLKELWRRLILNILIHNGDDHMRNHGFLLDHNRGWKLAPVFDINPIPDKFQLSLSIDGYSSEYSLNTALKTCEYYRIDTTEAQQIIKQIKSTRADWEKIARKTGVIDFEIKAMKEVFNDECV